ncbi:MULTISPECIES: 3-deoxy-manno-octulosonate cytidylyltransferase [Malaciobacter]|jgi:3-deoxy-manno-octulosonate cytidylyltransferase (CMP-KDO synthetase)|uniref:3-deoxy-manno-octulosonate cytidylyltransferase (CMP-KDO synthetase) n=2 Tax=Malaciobacter TaxID=2321114 RepID=A0AB36ZYT1_9BACT|nr:MULTISPECIES: 3-deoxy-manno-octulosonate cytidylyltransferase [Malaciobacter]PHO08933.1 3-deoxy-manno-octulosonate cytidylyltransferase [Malaciobacter canalis]PPK61253.1 3-deoxy-manno-octulosonate cytidylyltransferase (CMP-KDO synthetase) [Malaciobacter marinus]QEE32864.1 3-deoxy-D-manno-octulosonate cytidylyltransferase [Malaciobacter canalis]SKB60697.1 3-deoxy-manno-octulosonate cytidylyltransferase (CMP-KDO synthetase) [Malaciobacter marinus]
MIVIPARLNSSRFENKILVDILGLPMVIKTAMQVSALDKVVIATDSLEVLDLAKIHGYEAVLTSNTHQSGTDRINEAVNKLDLPDDEIIINVQADEPFIEPEVVKAVINRVKEVKKNNENTMIVSCYKKITSDLADDPNHVKVILDENSKAIYFSRAKVPYHRDHYENSSYNGHLGIYGFTKKSLNDFCSLKPSKLEKIEKLEQLRAIDNGYSIAMVEVDSKSFGIDTQEDLENALRIFKK